MKLVYTRWAVALAALVTFTVVGRAQPHGSPLNLWQDVAEHTVARKDVERRIVPNQYRTLALNFEAMKAVLGQAPDRFSPQATQGAVVIELPMPDGSSERFRVWEASIMHPDLQARYPEIRSYIAQGLSDPTAYARLGYSHKGFHAMVLSAQHSTVFIDPYAVGDTQHYVSYYKKDFYRSDASSFTCESSSVATDDFVPTDAPLGQNLLQNDCSLRIYRLALACTGEYAQYHGGTVADVLAEYNVAMSRVNGIYERDLAVTMQLVPNTDMLIFLDAVTDPYDNNNGGAMLSQNQTTCDNLIGSANYDIGHVFSTGGGGIAGLAVVCSSGGKARGVTGLGNPVGDPFYVDYVAHEIGHQFGGNHTFNNSCGGNRNNSTAVEPGSGSTIMAYAGICSPNVQNNSDDYFHAISIQEITLNIESGLGGTCPMTMNIDNTAPTVGVDATEYVLPISTPFMLTASAMDPDSGDVLTYCWEQMDNEIATQPPVATNTGGPAFRTWDPTPDPTRYFPNLAALVNNQTPTWEVLPSVSRQMNFRLTVRDNHLGGGCTDAEDVQLTFTDQAGPFVVTSPNVAETWFVGQPRMITWDVANTDQAPVSCTEVDILLSLDGGYTYPVSLAQNVPNTGSYSLIVPNQLSSSARIMVKCTNSVFFDISDQNFEITLPPDPTFFMGVAPASLSACPGDTLLLQIVLTGVSGFDEPVQLSMSGLPAGAMVSFAQDVLLPDDTTSALITGLQADDAGTYTLVVSGQSASVMQTVSVNLLLFGGIPGPVTPLLPADGSVEQSTYSMLQWTAQGDATMYEVQYDTSPSFASAAQISTDSVHVFLSNLEELTVYYWRVRAVNDCGVGDWSVPSAFQTGQSACQTWNATDVPVAIPSTVAVVSSTIEVMDDFELIDVNIPQLDITHTWVGDLEATLVAPDGTEIVLFDRPGVPQSSFGCDNDNINVSFDDEALASASQLENMCDAGPVAIFGAFQPIDPLATLVGKSAQGQWSLQITDHEQEDGGAITEWALELCRVVSPTDSIVVNTTALIVPMGTTVPITATHLTVADPLLDYTWTVWALPEYGTLLLGGVPLQVGSTFTQAQLEAGQLAYQHDGSMQTSDLLLLDVSTPNGGWLHALGLPIEILHNPLSIDVQVQSPSCSDAADGSITILASGGFPPLEYQLNGTSAQQDSVFMGLVEGTYAVIVTDVLGFADTTAVQLIAPDPIQPNAQVQGDSIVLAPVGGTPPYTYSLNDGPFQSEGVFADLPDGMYTVHVLDAHECVALQTVVVATQSLLATAVLIQDISCNNANDAVIGVIAAGGVPPYQYSIDGQNFQSDSLFSDLSEGSYTVTVQDAGGSTVQTSPITVTNPPLLTATAIADGYGIEVSASGGTPPYLYSLDGQVYQALPTFGGLDNGTYTVTVQDAHGCTTSAEATVNVPPLTAEVVVQQSISCFGIADGVLQVNASGGVSPYMYSLDGINWQDQNEFGALTAGSYMVWVRDVGNTVFMTGPVFIDQPTPFIVTAIAANHQIEVIVTGGTPPYMYSLDDGPVQLENLFTDVNTSGIYELTVIDAHGCVQTIMLEVSVVESADVVLNEPACAGDPVVIVVTNVEGGNPPYEYSLDGENWQLSPTLEEVITGTFYVYVRDNNGFVWQSSPYVVDLPPLFVMAEVEGNSVMLSATGGVPPYKWSIDGNVFSDSPIFTSLPNGNYMGYVQDANGCVQQVSFQIDVVQGAGFDITDVSCTGQSDGQIVVVDVEGGNGPYLYSLDSLNWQNEPVFEGLSAATYMVYIQDASGFVFSTTATVSEPQPLVLDATVNDADVMLMASGGVPPYQYSLDGGVTWQQSSTFTNLQPCDYTFLVRDFNGCLAWIEISVVPNAASDRQPLSFVLWPNPSDGHLSVQVPLTGQVTLQLIDAKGRVVQLEKWRALAGTTHVLSLEASLPAGIYIIRLLQGERIGYRSLVLMR